MGDDSEPTAGPEITDTPPPSNTRILWIMAVLGIAGGIAGMLLESPAFGVGVLVGTALAFANYYWLKSSLRKIFNAASSGERPRMLAGKYFIRYLVLGAVVAVIYAAGLLPIIPVVLGMAAFGFAVMLEGFIRIFSK